MTNENMTDKEINYRNVLYGITMYEKELDEIDKKCRNCKTKMECITENGPFYINFCSFNFSERKIEIFKDLEPKINYILENADEILKLRNIHWQHKLRVLQLKGCFE